MDISEVQLKNALVLAYLGDSVFTVMVRKYLVENLNLKPSGLNKIANSIVCAQTQALILEEMKPELNEKEKEIMLRARNSHINSKAKHSTLSEYSKATQFEAIVGFWFLTGEKDKLKNMFMSHVVGRI